MPTEIQARICRRCVLPDTFPGAVFDDEGVWTSGRVAETASELKENVNRLRA